jgi:ubiquitin carboxyl-terminal hydrolase 5/13
LVVKLGTIQARLDGGVSGDCYCYTCDDAVLDQDLDSHVAMFGLDPRTEEKTEKSTAELELEQNLSLELSRITEAGHDLRPVDGPGFTGLANLGNTCYMASVLQVLFAMPSFVDRFAVHGNRNFLQGARDAETQVARIADALTSGRFPAEHVNPRLLKSLVCAGHPEFSTSRQQDAAEFLEFFCDVVDRMHATRHDQNPVNSIRFTVQDRLQCTTCKGVRYTQHNQVLLPVEVVEDSVARSVEAAFSESQIDGFDCPVCKQRTTAVTQPRLLSYPDFLCVQLKRFVIDTSSWTVSKLDRAVTDAETLNVEPLRASHRGISPGEVEFPPVAATGSGASHSAAPKAAELQPDIMIVANLESMGFPASKCQRAALAVKNASVEAATEWLFAHMDDPEEETAEKSAPANKKVCLTFRDEDVAMLTSMGFSVSQAKRALYECNNRVDTAVEWIFEHPDETIEAIESKLAEAPSPIAGGSSAASTGQNEMVSDGQGGQYELFALVSHIGKSTASGHYVAHIRKTVDGQPRFVLFNDGKVAVSEEPPKDLAYVYVYRRV